MYACNNRINIMSLNKLFKIDIFNKCSVELKEFLNNISNGPDLKKYTVKKLRFCPECIKLGSSSTGTLFYKYIVNEFNIYLTSYRNNECISIHDYGILVEALEHIIGVLLMKHYNNWLSYAISMKENHPNEIIDFESTICPPILDFYVVFNKNSQTAQVNTINLNEYEA